MKRLCVLALVALLTPPAFAHDALPLDAEFEDRVRAYLLANPEVILEALEVLSKREAAAQTAAKIAQFPDLFERPPRLGMGDEAAPLRVVEFFDYKCVPCKAVHGTLETLTTSNPQLRIEMRHLPILTPASERATRFALASLDAYGTETYQSVHTSLWTHKGPYGTALFARVAQEHNLDFALIEGLMWSGSVSQQIETNRTIALSLEIVGTPAFVTQDAVSIGNTDPAFLSDFFLSQ